MNKKEINEIKKNFSDDSGFFTVNHVVTAFVDAEKNIKCKTNQLYTTIEQDESELIMINLKKTLSGTIGKNLLEYAFPKDAYLEGGSQPFLYKVLQSRFTDDEITDEFLNRIVEKMEYVSTYTIFAAHCTYSVANKTKMGELDMDDDFDNEYNFIVTAICPVELRIDGLVYNEEDNAIAKKITADRIVELPTDGFVYPLFSDRAADVNGVLYYTKKPKNPNISIIEELLGCEFSMDCASEKEAFQTILNDAIGEDLDYEVITKVNDCIQKIVDENAHETEIPTIDSNKLSNILWESGISQDKLEDLPKVFEHVAGEKPLTAVNLVDKKTVVTASGITVNIGKDSVDKVSTQVVNGKRCLIIALDEPELTINGIDTKISDINYEQTPELV